MRDEIDFREHAPPIKNWSGMIGAVILEAVDRMADAFGGAAFDGIDLDEERRLALDASQGKPGAFDRAERYGKRVGRRMRQTWPAYNTFHWEDRS